ncbi:alanyl-tRNA synthetase [Spiroplasma sp. TIUS-1]|uniref:alanine--tRNA ligase n=1 Tax=Spiroplasma sp. TIUS-1 TaxID=216963 RepID=UPI001397B604|nr:alanine--tRNA ligase [Spiroplasma sp. TIUS-1]QHX36184.1 alanyl-tRNA synthetase [Spiroplasma sp. TIUS-1]
MKKLSANEVRKIWLDFFKSKQHHFLEPVSLVPVNDPSLLWINSGVATLKPYFDGRLNPPSQRLTNSQKAIRTNDIENVGVTARHQTMFEMLGNFSIGDYFKKEAIQFAWELLTSKDWYAMPIEKLYVTVFDEDDEAFNIWKDIIGLSEDKIFKMGRDTNFWDVGQGPCGPNSEIFFDRGEIWDPKNIGVKLLKDDIENDRYIEVWNIVFSQFNNDGQNNYTALPRKNIDTGAGLERMVSIFQETPTNFETDLFMPTIRAVEKLTTKRYSLENYFKPNKEQTQINTAFKIIADHIRACTFAIADGAFPSNKDRGYIIRRLIRRSSVYAKALGINKPFLSDLVDVVISTMSGFYTYLKDKKDIVKKSILEEETKFLKTLTKGYELFNEIIKREKSISAKNALLLFESYGFPIEIITELGERENIKVDLDGFDKLFNDAKEIAKNANKNNSVWNKQSKILTDLKVESEFVGYETLTTRNSKVVFMFANDKELSEAKQDQVIQIILDKTPFYAEKGGQANDTGILVNNDGQIHKVIDVQSGPNGQNIHTVVVGSKILLGDLLITEVDEIKRDLTANNHSGTHLLHATVREVLGNDATQTGSYNNEDGFRLDISFNRMPTQDEIVKISNQANKYIAKNFKREVYYCSLKDAIEKHNAIALFSDKYDSEVRVVKFSNVSSELCGGTHVPQTGIIEKLFVTSVESKGSGVYRFTALTTESKIQEFLEEQFSKQRNEILGQKNKFIELSKIKSSKSIASLIEKIDSLKIIEENYTKIKELVFEFKNEFKLYQKAAESEMTDSIVDKFKSLEPINNKIVLINDSLDMQMFKKISDILQNKYDLLIFEGFNELLKVCVISSSDPKIPAIDILKNNPRFEIKGGGNSKFAQGKIIKSK